MPGGRLHSRSRHRLADLSAADRAHVDALFDKGRSVAEPAGADQFSYRVTRQTSAGPESVMVTEEEIPPALQAGFHDDIE